MDQKKEEDKGNDKDKSKDSKPLKNINLGVEAFRFRDEKRGVLLEFESDQYNVVQLSNIAIQFLEVYNKKDDYIGVTGIS
jgi:hypothetical protein